jgi:hypothetical protein
MIKMDSNDEETDMILIYGECNKNASTVARYQTINISPKTLRFFTISFNQANDVYVKITKLHSYVLCFLNQKTNIHINFKCIVDCIFNSVELIIVK